MIASLYWKLAAGAVVLLGAGAVAWYASGPGVECPTKAQKQAAFDAVRAGSLTEKAVNETVAPAWEKCGLRAEAEALRAAAKNPALLDAAPTSPAGGGPHPSLLDAVKRHRRRRALRGRGPAR